MLKRTVICIGVLSVVLFFAAAIWLLAHPVPMVILRHWLGVSDRPRYVITYYDRNHDGEVDLEIHQADATDSDWGLIDTDFKGSYDSLWVNGVQGRSYPVHVPIPGGVSITKEVPQRYRAP
jgi:hypothetical protein